MLTKKILLAAIPFATLVGCGGDDGPKPIVHDAPIVTEQPDAFVPVECKAQETYSMLVPDSGLYVGDYPLGGGMPARQVHYQNIQGALQKNTDSTDVLSAYLVEETDVEGSYFQNGITQQTVIFDRTMDSSIDVYIWPQLSDSITGIIPAEYLATERYLAFSGTLVLTEVSTTPGENFSAIMMDVEFVHVHEEGDSLVASDDDGMGGTCVSKFTNLSLAGTYVSGDAQALKADGHRTVSIKQLGRKAVRK